MNNKKRVADLIQQYPDAPNEVISTTLKINENSVKSYISQLKTGGFIEVEKIDGKRVITTLEEYTASKSSATAEKLELKQEVYTKLLEVYIDDFDLTDDIDKHLKLGNSIMRILDNL